MLGSLAHRRAMHGVRLDQHLGQEHNVLAMRKGSIVARESWGLRMSASALVFNLPGLYVMQKLSFW